MSTATPTPAASDAFASADGPYNIVKTLNFTSRFVAASWVRRAKDFPVRERTIVVNLDAAPARMEGTGNRTLPAFSSTILANTRITSAESLVLLRVEESADIAGIVREPGWALLGDLIGDAPHTGPGRPFPRQTPLWRGPQDAAGRLRFDPAYALGESAVPGPRREFQVKVNLWFAPEHTDCAIHNQHDFIEVHTQVHGIGRMQKFHEQDHGTLYEDVLMSPGYTTPMPFCATSGDTFVYPWHQYRADTPCVWLAVEYHLDK